MNNQIETYANITNFPNYQVSTFGNVKNVKSGRILKPGSGTGGGYLMVILMDDGERSMKTVHRLVAITFLENPEHKKCVDHIDRNKLNNHISNLRYATVSENAQNVSINTTNTSGVRGVSWDKKLNKWKVQITANGIRKHLGRFANKDDAITARANAEIQYFKEFRAVN